MCVLLVVVRCGRLFFCCRCYVGVGFCFCCWLDDMNCGLWMLILLIFVCYLWF